MICMNSIILLIEKNTSDMELLNLIEECLLSFDEYHASIYKMETWCKLYGYRNTSKEDYRTKLTELDKSRSICHNSVISNIKILNRLCLQQNIPVVYEGIVSEERPYRVEIADSVLAYVEKVSANRLK